MKTIAVLGAGSWGTALASLLVRNGHQVNLWDRDQEVLKDIQTTGKNTKYLDDIELHTKSLHCIFELQKALENADVILIAVPSHAFTNVVLQIKPLLKNQAIVWATKGLETKTGAFLHQVIERELDKNLLYAVLSGPSFAKEVAKGLPTAITLAANDLNQIKKLADIFHNDFFRVYVTQDITGVELGGVVKNILAVAAGISDGLQLGSNARAALLTRGLAEMMRLGDALGAKRETLMGLAGCGDIILTCTDDQSRNRRFGSLLAKGLSEANAIKQIGQAVEAVYNVEQLCNLAKEKHVELPISEQVFRIMKQGASAKDAVTTLFSRSLKSE